MSHLQLSFIGSKQLLHDRYPLRNWSFHLEYNSLLFNRGRGYCKTKRPGLAIESGLHRPPLSINLLFLFRFLYY